MKQEKKKIKYGLLVLTMDQEYLGGYTSKDGKNQTLSLFQQLKKLETQLKILPIEQKKEIPGENLKYDLSNGGVTLARDNASDEAWKAVEAAKADIVSGKIEVPAK